MKNFWNRIKPALFISFWVIVSGGVVVLLGAAFVENHAEKFNRIEVSVDESDGNLFVGRSDIVQLLQDHQINAQKSKAVGDINYQSMEQAIEANPYIESARLFVDANRNIQVEVKQKLPVLRIINSQRVSYYLDDHGKRMPCSSKFTARVPVATGYIITNAEHPDSNDLMLEKKLFVLADFIRHDSLLNALFGQIVVNEKQEFELIPSVGNHSVLIGDVNDLDRKFSKLKVFYREGLKHAGWDEYSLINLKYENEVYCTRRNANTSGNTVQTNNVSTENKTPADKN